MAQMRYVGACEHGTWHLMTHPPGEPSKARPVPFRCRSWRHEGECRQWKGAQDFCRIRDAIEAHNNWVFVTLTFKQSEWWDWKEQYKLAWPLWSMLRLRLWRKYAKIPYIQIWERHKIQGIHAHVLITNAEMHADVEDDWRKHGNIADHKKRVDRILRDRQSWHFREFIDHCTAVGFGPRCFCRPMRGGTGKTMAGYFVKLASELTGAGEKNQIPIDAPPHFRRLRASPRLLPPVLKSGMSGYLVCKPFPGSHEDEIV